MHSQAGALLKSIFVLIAGAAIAAIWVVSTRLEIERGPQPTDSIVKEAFKAIHHPASATEVGGHSFQSKSGAILAQSRFTMPAAPNAVIEFYRAELQRNTWQKLKVFKAIWGSGSWGETYCKGNLMATITIINSPNNMRTYYAFGVSWNSKTAQDCGG